MRRLATLVGLGVLGLSLTSLTTAHAAPTPDRTTPPQSPAVTSIRQLRLATGNTVLVVTRGDGQVSASVLGRTPFIWSGGRDARYVVPRAPAARLRQLDLSLFDVTALGQVTRHGRTPVVVRLLPGVRTARVAGLRLDEGSARTVRRVTRMRGSYGRHFPGFTARDLRGISSVRLDAPRPALSSADGVPTHTVQVHVTRADGHRSHFAYVTLASTVDEATYDGQVAVDHTGTATFTDVPEGEYSAIVFNFSRLVVDRQLEVSGDQSLQLDLGDATVKPHVTLPGQHTLSTALTVERDPENGFGIPFGFSGPHFSVRVQPTPGRVRNGTLHTGVSATFVTGRAVSGYHDVAVTEDDARGVPDDLAFVHHRRDFARVTDLFYANGRAAQRPLMLFPATSHAFFLAGDTDLDTPVPGRLHVWVQAGRGHYLQQTVFPLATELHFRNLTQVGDDRSYPHPGRHTPISFLHGPVGPGLEVPPHARSTSGVVRLGNRLQLFVPVISGSGGPGFDFADRSDGSWSLRQGPHLLAHGHQVISGVVDVPRGLRAYRLAATAHPGPAWDLSTRVHDDWLFHSRAGKRSVPLLTPSYVPPTDLSGNLGPGHTGYRLSFHSTPHSARVTQVSVELSTDDGHSWHAVRVTRTSGLTFHVGYRNPAARGDRRYVSLRVRAVDAHGNHVEETAIHAYRLR